MLTIFFISILKVGAFIVIKSLGFSTNVRFTKQETIGKGMKSLAV